MGMRLILIGNMMLLLAVLGRIIWTILGGEPTPLVEMPKPLLDVFAAAAAFVFEGGPFVMAAAALVVGLMWGQMILRWFRFPEEEYPYERPVRRPPRYEIAERIRICPHCGEDQPSGDRCQHCARRRDIPEAYYTNYAQNNRFCFACGTDYPPDAQFCIGCGAPMPVTGKTRVL